MGYEFSADRRRVLLAGAAALVAPAMFGSRQASAAASEVIVEVANGKLRGLRTEDAMSFRGIPYAADTGGANRFMAPRPVVSWTGVRDAVEFR